MAGKDAVAYLDEWPENMSDWILHMVVEHFNWPEFVFQGVNAFRNTLRAQEMINLIQPDKISILFRILHSEAH